VTGLDKSAVHCCAWPGCTRAVPVRLWGCKEHWYMLPRELRERILAAHRPGQTAATWSAEYRAAVSDAARFAEALVAVTGERAEHVRRRCPSCGDYAIDGKVTCGRAECGFTARYVQGPPSLFFTCRGCGAELPYGNELCAKCGAQ